MAIRIQVEGMSQLRRALKLIGDPVLAGQLRAAHAKVSDMVAAATAAEAPERTGKLKASVKARPTQTAGRIFIGTPVRVPYAGPIHFGWKKRNIEPNKFAYRGIRRAGELRIADVYAKDIDRILRRAGMKAGLG